MFPTATATGMEQIPVYELFSSYLRQKQQFRVRFLTITIEEDKQSVNGTRALLSFVKAAEKNKWKRPKDIGQKHDKYFLEVWNEK